MGQNRVVQGRMVNPKGLAELIEEAEGDDRGDVMEATEIEDAERECPECGGDVLQVGYMPNVSEFVTGLKCQECDWHETDRE
ncbi:DUF5795 family protein [Halalkalicoccus salilacus]|uniref:DUF5795 family protein n=1 Tax=Halalkalicoccus salilacus TaxID=3117459 RepID=UPI00300F6411